MQTPVHLVHPVHQHKDLSPGLPAPAPPTSDPQVARPPTCHLPPQAHGGPGLRQRVSEAAVFWGRGACCPPHLRKRCTRLPTAPRFNRLPLLVSGCFRSRANRENQASKPHRLPPAREGTGIRLAPAVPAAATSVAGPPRPSLSAWTPRTIPHRNNRPQRRLLPLPAIWPPRHFLLELSQRSNRSSRGLFRARVPTQGPGPCTPWGTKGTPPGRPRKHARPSILGTRQKSEARPRAHGRCPVLCGLHRKSGSEQPRAFQEKYFQADE